MGRELSARACVILIEAPENRTGRPTMTFPVSWSLARLSAAVPSGAFDVSHWAGAKVIAALAGAGYHPGRRPTNQMRRRCLH